MKYNYPIKYAVMPIYDQVGWSRGLNDLERKYEIVYNIVSKCYVINETINYFATGNSEKRYGVVFPYIKNGMYEEWDRVFPSYNEDLQNSNLTTVDNIYDDFDKALENANMKNMEVLEKMELGIPYTSDGTYKNRIDGVKKIYKKRERKYKKIEELIDKETEEMEINPIRKEQSIITMNEANDKIISISIYDFIKYYRNCPFYVCTVSNDQYKQMKKQIITTGRLAERNPHSSVEYDKFGYLLANDIENEIIRITNSSDKSGSYYLDDNEILCYDSDMKPFDKDSQFSKKIMGIKVYTTETYDDIINAYKKSHTIDLAKQKIKK